MKTRSRSLNKIYLPAGFSFSAACAGIKASGRPDLALVEACPGTSAAAVFTKNRVVAAPVVVGRTSLAASRGRVRAVIVNSGNANCATGKAGLQACQRACSQLAVLLGTPSATVFPSSTGIIGVPLPVEKILSGLPALVGARAATKKGAADFARAIMTTDTRPKLASTRFRSGDAFVNVLGIAKGAGMIHPQLATMLVYLFTDIGAGPAELRSILRHGSDQTFNCISIDGDTSTNDTVLLLASGRSGVRLASAAARASFSTALLQVCQSLAEQIVTDGEGVRHVIQLSVEQARNRQEALQVARTIAHSLLVKTAWAGADPNWGRILAAVGRSGIAVNPERVTIVIGDQTVCRNGTGCAFDEKRAHEALGRPKCAIRVLLARGRSSAVFLTADLTAEYVRINADYST
ncbi:MAG TPA: bifunctional glutamate N-acetyltransferase/amino-acid acetyltransferase ArgJ [Terriglobales bacterium]|jgi:glutamate N-acetyltransferase/amino-acid N-acetyltransferase|nr:bifunctional glutamate N-acetyltransferase/amino-acid acetyltransferase ArgJ [Terriglobales bacterium]